MMRIKKGDTVKILSGKDRAKTGKVLRVDPLGERILVEGVNLRKKHVRSKRQDKKGEIILLPAPVAAAKLMPMCSHCKKPTRPRFVKGDAGKTRVCRSCNQSF